MHHKPFLFLFVLAILSPFLQAQNDSIGFNFRVIRNLPSTSVKDQAFSGTCWAFATVSFIESELLRMGKDTLDVSEMFFVNYAYKEKSERYVRFHGNTNLGQGGQAHDVLNIIKIHGMVPESVYPGLLPGEKKHRHGELEAMVKAAAGALIKNPDRQLSKAWEKAMGGIVDAYLGEHPRQFSYNGKNYTPESFLKAYDFDPDDYVSLTSYSHHPFYEPFILEIPDNWAHNEYINVPLDDLMETLNAALDQGYTVCWDGDVSDKGFSHNKGVAIVPDVELADYTGSEKSRWQELTEKERQKTFFSFERPVPERKITDADRLQAFNNYSSTDDHLMHITGKAVDRLGNLYYITKNSWGDKSNEQGGFLNMSEAYVRLNTIAITLHKKAIPAHIRAKCNIK
ncbi:MAG: C1 family peptidase [Bacteroidota bacterium]